MTPAPTPAPGTAGLILCGGRSSRMGRDKAALRFGAETLLARVLRRMRAVADPVVVALAPESEPPPLPPGVWAVPDPSAHAGPLVGLAEGFRRLQGHAKNVIVTPVDMPFFDEPWLLRLAEGLSRAPAVLYRYEGFANALTAAYRLTLLPKLERLIAEGQRRPIALPDGEGPLILEVEALWPDGEGPPPLMDVDTPEDYRNALRWEGLGNAAGAAVTVSWRGPGGAPAPPLPLWAATPAEALALAARVDPDRAPWLERLRREGRALRGEPGAGREVDWETVLADGETVTFDQGGAAGSGDSR